MVGLVLVFGRFFCFGFFFSTKEKYKSLFLWESAKFLPVAAVLGPPSLCYFLFILYFGVGFLSARGPAGGGDELPFLVENNFSPWTTSSSSIPLGSRELPGCPPSSALTRWAS